MGPFLYGWCHVKNFSCHRSERVWDFRFVVAVCHRGGSQSRVGYQVGSVPDTSYWRPEQILSLGRFGSRVGRLDGLTYWVYRYEGLSLYVKHCDGL